MNNIMDGVGASLTLKKKIANEIKQKNLKPCLAVIQVGDNKASDIYVRNKNKACDMVGIKFINIKLPDTISEDLIISEIERLNLKDVDGLTYPNVGNLVLENECLVSCTPMGVMELLDMYNVSLKGKNACIVGRSNLVGKPLIQLLLARDATVSICHSKSLDIKSYTKMADVLIVAAGHPNLITKDMVKEGAVVIDVGINKENDSLVGDVSFDEVSKKASLITPVPGGVGPMTIASLLKNVVKAYKFQNGK